MDAEIIMNPEKHGYKICGHCNGYGSSLKDPATQIKCSKCHGTGLLKEKKNENAKNTC